MFDELVKAPVGNSLYLTKNGEFYYKNWKGEFIRKVLRKRQGYLEVKYVYKKKRYYIYAHKLVAMTFIKNPNNYKEVNHIDCNKENNYIGNLEWCTRKQNMEHASRNGKMKNSGGWNRKTKD